MLPQAPLLLLLHNSYIYIYIYIYTYICLFYLMGDKFGVSLWRMLENVSWTEYLKIRTNRLNRLLNKQLHNLYSSLLMNWMYHLQHKWRKRIIYNLKNAFNGNLHVNVKCCRFPPVIHNFLSFFALSDVCPRQPWNGRCVLGHTVCIKYHTRLAHFYSTCLEH